LAFWTWGEIVHAGQTNLGENKMIYNDFPTKKYNLIVVDPPWNIKKLTHKTRSTQITMDYPTLSIEDIKLLPIQNISAEYCFLFLWTTQKYLDISKEILEFWGFNLLLTMVWEKTYGKSAGMPLFGFRWNAEFIRVGYTQKPKLWPKRPLIPAVFQAENIRHSQKPDVFYDMIAPLGNMRIDLFARKTRQDWDVWGNEV
jgi:N6-adenosine-specific RNA methylase IME4